MSDRSKTLRETIDKDEAGILERWIDKQLAAPSFRSDRISKTELAEHSRRFLSSLRQSLGSGTPDVQSPAWANVRQMLEDISVSRAQQGFSPSETALFIFSLKETLFEQLNGELPKDPKALAAAIIDTNQLLDKLGLYTTEVYQTRTREGDRAAAAGADGAVDAGGHAVGRRARAAGHRHARQRRTQVVMENLLQRIVETGALIAIIDITGVPTVDTLTAQHLLKTVAAARLMGADCIISGIRPQIAQTIVHLGVDLGTVVTKATLADAFAIALRRLGLDGRQGRHDRQAPPGRRGAGRTLRSVRELTWNASRSSRWASSCSSPSRSTCTTAWR